jgi:hypothetical protein
VGWDLGASVLGIWFRRFGWVGKGGYPRDD